MIDYTQFVLGLLITTKLEDDLFVIKNPHKAAVLVWYRYATSVKPEFRTVRIDPGKDARFSYFGLALGKSNIAIQFCDFSSIALGLPEIVQREVFELTFPEIAHINEASTEKEREIAFRNLEFRMSREREERERAAYTNNKVVAK